MIINYLKVMYCIWGFSCKYVYLRIKFDRVKLNSAANNCFNELKSPSMLFSCVRYYFIIKLTLYLLEKCNQTLLYKKMTEMSYAASPI